MSNTKTSRIGSIVAFVVSGIFIALATWLFFNRQYVLDQLTVWSYTPTSEVESISNKVGFTENGKFVFYATKPEIASHETFNQECPRQETGSPILGCYTTNDRIYIYDLTNEQLMGMEEVTAAHEMLHAVWFRMSDEEKASLTEQLKAAYEKVDNPSLKTRMEYYERTEPGEFANELHSILGTEIHSLGEPLESYYARYFDRQATLALHDKYNDVYQALYARADELYANMQQLSSTIKAEGDRYDAAAAQLSSDINTFNARARSGAFTSQAQFNAERSALVRRSNALNQDRIRINGYIATYNTYYAEYQEIAKQVEVLNDSIDSYSQIDEGPSV